jgi:hypothetical protein
MHSMPPRITEKSYRLRVSNRTMVGVLEPTPVCLRSLRTEGVEPSSYETVEQTPSVALVCEKHVANTKPLQISDWAGCKSPHPSPLGEDGGNIFP